jgi:hypothetical protein
MQVICLISLRNRSKKGREIDEMLSFAKFLEILEGGCTIVKRAEAVLTQ